MTKAIGAGTRNLALNFVEPELQIIRLEAFKRNLSMKEFFMRVFRRGLAMHDPATAKKLVAIKRERVKSVSPAKAARIRRGRNNALRTGAMLAIVVGYLFAGGDDMRRTSCRVLRAPRLVGRREA